MGKEEQVPLNWYKENINLVHLAISQYGFVPNYKHSSKYGYGQNAWYTLENPETGENFIFSLNRQANENAKPHYYYQNTSGGKREPTFGKNDTDRGSIFDFVMFREGLGLGKIIGKLKHYKNEIEPKLTQDELFNIADLKPSERIPFGHDIYKFFNIKPLDTKKPPEEIIHFLKLRSIPLDFLSNPKFCNNLYVRQYTNQFDQQVTDLCFPIISPTQKENGLKECGFSAINQMFYQNRSFKQILGFKQDGLWFSSFDKTKPLDKFVVSESPIDSISHYYLHPELHLKNVLYAATIGYVSKDQCHTIEESVIDKYKPQSIDLACDNDAAGQKFNLFIASETRYLNENLKFMIVNFQSDKKHQASVQINFNTGTKENNTLLASQIQNWIAERENKNNTIEEENRLHKIHCHVLSLDENKGSLAFDFFSLAHNWNKITDLVNEYKFKNVLNVNQCLPINKDFNKDLQVLEMAYKVEEHEHYQSHQKPIDLTFQQYILKNYRDKELMNKTILDPLEKIDQKTLNVINEEKIAIDEKLLANKYKLGY